MIKFFIYVNLTILLIGLRSTEAVAISQALLKLLKENNLCPCDASSSSSVANDDDNETSKKPRVKRRKRRKRLNTDSSSLAQDRAALIDKVSLYKVFKFKLFLYN